jgi:hypothetical protein
LKKKKISTTGHAGALTDLVVLKNAGYSGYAQYLEILRKARPNLAVKVHCTQKKESHPQKREWRPKPIKANGMALARTNMMLVLPPEFYAPDRKELPVA